jgi:hypothetical protein
MHNCPSYASIIEVSLGDSERFDVMEDEMFAIIIAMCAVGFSIYKMIDVIAAIRNRAIGEIVFAFVLSAVAASLAAVIGFVVAALLCVKLLSGEGREAGLVLAPATALVFAVVTFSICFRKVITYGESS